jgi:hypothetical protein
MMNELVEIERRLWTNDAAIYEDSLVEDAVLVFAETGPISRDFAVEAIRGENEEGRRWAEVDFEDVRVSKLTADAQLLLYRFNARWEQEEKWVKGLASSVYVDRGNGWKLAFHQQTPLP